MNKFIVCPTVFWKNLHALALTVIIGAVASNPGLAQDTSGNSHVPASSAEDVNGTWTYRSFHNIPDLVAGDPNRALGLIFAEATFDLDIASDGTVTGELDWGSGGLDLSGTVEQETEGETPIVSILGLGREGTQTEGWRYDYHGRLAHRWPNGVNQVPSIVGTVIRVEPHGGAAAGYVASFIAVKRP